jgi:glycosyltransferase involved in cell wall biosynthesis
MAETIKNRNVPETSIFVINNSALSEIICSDELLDEFRKPRGKIRIIFAGNLGRFQNLHLLTKGVARYLARHENSELVFLGDGREKASLERDWGTHPQIKFFPYLPFTQAKVLLEEADIGLVSLQPGIYKVSFPSKIVTYSKYGLPSLVLVERRSTIADLVQDNGLGIVPSEFDANEISDSLEQLMMDTTNHTKIKIKRWYINEWSSSIGNAQWSSLINSL